MHSGSREFPPEVWEQIHGLFGDMIEASDPWPILAQEPDRTVAEAAEQLFRNHQRATQKHFLEEPLAIVRDLASPERPQFVSGQVLVSRFTIKHLLGSGGMGEVYLADDDRLNEVVAIKTIRVALAAIPSIRRRFLSEIQNARRVTHPHVCRIFDLFEEGDIPFFAMEYLEGPRLSDWLREAHPPSAARKRVALGLAEGLEAAHRNGIIHCDFKPANVILTGRGSTLRPVITDFGLARALSAGSATNTLSLQAGTLAYMAPELRQGAHGDVRSDIYAFGKVLAELAPGHRIVAACTADHPQDRPQALEGVIQELKGSGLTRRVWLMGAAAAPVMGLAAYKLLARPRLALVSRQRLAFNGFRPVQNSTSGLLRDLMIAALRQSLLVTVVPDARISTILSKLNLPATLPAEHANLVAAAEREGIPLLIEGTVNPLGNTLNCLLQIFRPGTEEPALEILDHVGDARDIVRLAERMALEVRREFGESAAALHSGYTPLANMTSPSPDALEFYFRAVRLYETGEAEAAAAWLDQALRIDPQFALAHLYLGLSLAARFKLLSSVEAFEHAYSLRGRVSERERLWIESQYYNITADYVSSLETSQRLVALYPDEATFQRHVAFAFAASGRPHDALPYSQRAVELDPSSDNNVSELIANHAEANLCDEALARFQQLRADGHTTTLLDRAAGLAWMGKGEYENARLAFERMGQDAKRERWSRVLRCAPAILEGRFADSAAALASDLAWDEATGEQNHSLTRRIWLGNLWWLMDEPDRALTQAEALLDLEPSVAFLEQIRQGGLLALRVREENLVNQALAKLRDIERHWPSTHTRGARAHLEGALLSNQNGDGGRLLEAAGLWPDPLTLLTQAQWLRRQNNLEAALAVTDVLQEQRGRVFRRYFPGIYILGLVERARCLMGLSRFDDALRVYERIGQHWLRGPKEYSLLSEAREELNRARRSAKGVADD